MKVLVMSHSCVIAVNQQIYVDLADLPGVEVALIVPDQWKSEYDGSAIKPTFLREATFPVHPLPVGRIGSVTQHYYKRLPVDQFRGWKPDIVLASQEPYSFSGWQALRLARQLFVPFVFQTNQNIMKRYPPPFSLMERQALKSAVVALAYSEEARQVMIAKGRIGQSAVLPYATDIRLFRAGNADSDIAQRVTSLKAKLGLHDDSIVIGYIGRLVPEKGLDTLLEAVALLDETLRNCVQILFVGSGAAEQSLRDEALRLGLGSQVVFAGTVSHSAVPEYMAALDLFVLPSRTTPSWKEQFGRVIIEALACGVPVVGSDSGQIPHLLSETDGGVSFPEGDVPALSARLRELIDNPKARKAMGERGRRAVVEGFTTDAIARRLRDILAACVAESNPA